MMSKHMAQELMGQWLNPPAAFRGKPFWSWNGKLEESELLRQLGLFKDMGMGGVFFHSRTGLATEYLGTEWMELTKACADEAARLLLDIIDKRVKPPVHKSISTGEFIARRSSGASG